MLSPQYRKVVLDNGVTLVAEKHDHVRSVSIGVWVKVGSVFESKVQSGISHFLEHMVFKGTTNRTPLQIATVLESLGGDLNAFTDREVTCYHATVLSEHVDIALDVLSDIVIHPVFPKAEMEKERKVLLQEMQMVRESPDDWIHDLFFQQVWHGHSLGQSIIGTEKSVNGISRAQLIKFFETHYVPENIIVSVAGNVDFEALKERCERFFQFKRTQEALPLERTAPRFLPRKKWGKFSTDQTHLLIGFEGMSFKDPYRFDGLMLSFFLGGGMSSRLFQEIREKAGLAYTVECDFVPFTETGVFGIYAGVQPRNLTRCLQILGKELKRTKEIGLTDAELDLVKGQLKGAILLSSDSMDVRQESLGRNEVVFGQYVPVDEVIAEIEKVTPERICELANKLFQPEREAIVTLSKSKPKKKGLTVFE
jgi:predicted Zn-dependent peptidase